MSRDILLLCSNFLASLTRSDQSQASRSWTNSSPVPKRSTRNMPTSQPKAKVSKAASRTDTGTGAAELKRQLGTAQDALDEQEEAIRHLNREASHHEHIMRQQQQKISQLTSVPHTAAQDYAQVLADANGKLHRHVASLKERNGVLETELSMARRLFERMVPAETALKEENERLRAALGLTQMKMDGNGATIRDRQIGLDTVKENILERAADSSWQRSLLTNGFFNALPREVAENFLHELNEAMLQKMAEQAARKPDSGPPNSTMAT